MELVLNTFKDFFGIVEGKYVIAGTIMVIVSIIILYVLFLIISSIRKRKSSLAVSLPDINASESEEEKGPRFHPVEEIVIELIDPEEDLIPQGGAKIKDDEFLTSLTLETGQLIIDEKLEQKIDMPEVGEINYDEIKEMKKKEKEEEVINHLRKVAEADNDEELTSHLDEISSINPKKDNYEMVEGK